MSRRAIDAAETIARKHGRKKEEDKQSKVDVALKTETASAAT